MRVELAELMSPRELYRTRAMELVIFAPCGGGCGHPPLDLRCADCGLVEPLCRQYVYMDLRGGDAVHIPLCVACGGDNARVLQKVRQILKEVA